jgi:acetolactate synthase-1/2/3 large subunit
LNTSDLIFDYLSRRGVRDVFMLSGGGIMHLTDALGRAPALRHWCNYHEQACVIAAESYSRITGSVGVCLVTSGPGAANALSAVAGSWVESVPVMVISGQVRRDLIADYSRWRQLGPQELNIVEMARPVTKYAVELTDPDDAATVMDDAWMAATSGRPGPVWVSIPLDVQGASVEDGAPPALTQPTAVAAASEAALREAATALATARRPVIVCGNGIHLAHAEAAFDRFVRHFRLPVVAAIGGMDLLEESHPYYFGRFGPTGQRRANFVLQNADLLLCLGTSMSVAAIGFNTSQLAPGATRVFVNVDAQEATKPHFQPDVTVVSDVKEFMTAMVRASAGGGPPERARWLKACDMWKAKYSVLTDDYLHDKDHVNSYYLAFALSQHLDVGEVILTGNSLDAVSVFHSFLVKKGQRVMANTNHGAMGWDLPALVGACVARPGERAVLITGDGSVLLNSQELLTLGANDLNAKVFVLNNGGYQSIRSTQKTFCEGRFIGCDPGSGVFNPSFEALAAAYGLRYSRLGSNDEVEALLPGLLNEKGPHLCEVNVAYEQERAPRVASRQQADGTFVSTPLHDQYPFLPAEEIRANMIMFADEL